MCSLNAVTRFIVPVGISLTFATSTGILIIACPILVTRYKLLGVQYSYRELYSRMDVARRRESGGCVRHARHALIHDTLVALQESDVRPTTCHRDREAARR